MAKHVHLILHVKWWCHDVELSSNHFLRRVILFLDNFNFINWGSLQVVKPILYDSSMGHNFLDKVTLLSATAWHQRIDNRIFDQASTMA